MFGSCWLRQEFAVSDDHNHRFVTFPTHFFNSNNESRSLYTCIICTTVTSVSPNDLQALSPQNPCLHHFHSQFGALKCCECPFSFEYQVLKNEDVKWANHIATLISFIQSYRSSESILMNGLSTLHMYVYNMVVEHRRDKIRVQNIKFQQSLGCLSMSKELMTSIGFSETGEFYELPVDTNHLYGIWNDYLLLLGSVLSKGQSNCTSQTYSKPLMCAHRSENDILELIQSQAYMRKVEITNDQDFYEGVLSNRTFSPSFQALGVSPDMADEIIAIAVEKCLQDLLNSSIDSKNLLAEIPLLMDALEDIAKGRQSLILHGRLSDYQTLGYGTSEMITSAFVALGTNDRGLDDMTILSLFDLAKRESNDAAALKRGVFMIAKCKNSTLLLESLANETVAHGDKLMPIGLNNIGNTCYLNSLLQCFFSFPKIRDAVLSFSSTEISSSVDFDNDSNKCLLNLQDLFKQLQAKEKAVVEPTHFLADSLLGSTQRFGYQQDITECMESLITLLEKTLSKSLISDFFYGETKQVLLTPDNKVLEKIELFTSIILEADSAKTINEALDKYMARTSVEYGKEKSDLAKRQILLHKAPEILTIQLQRAIYNKSTGSTYKSNQFVRFPPTINLAKYLEGFKNRENFESIQQSLNETDKIIASLEPLPNHANVTPVDLALQLTKILANDPVDVFNDDEVLIMEDNKENDLIGDALDGDERKRLNELLGEFANRRNLYSLEDLKEKQKRLVESMKELDDETLGTLSYKLHAVYMHRGEASHGHYWIYIFDKESKIWFKFNDSLVSIIDEDEVYRDTTGETGNAYCLVYEKIVV